MKRLLPGIIFTLIFSVHLAGQSTLPNMGLEEWIDSTGFYEEPSGGVWTTANRIVLLNPDIFKETTFKTEDAYAGQYAAKIVTDIALLPPPNDMLLTGTLATGWFDVYALPPTNLKMGVPFTARPVRFKGYYKYFSVEHDSCDIWAILTKWNSVTLQRDTIGDTYLTDTVIVSEYTLFNLPFQYYSEDDPDSISVVFASSAAGDLFLGSVGSTLFVDEISLELSNGTELLLMPEVVVRTYPNPASNIVCFELNAFMKDGKLILLNSQGKSCSSQQFKGKKTNIDLANYPEGIYFYQLFEGNRLINGGSIIRSAK